jgi:hypothetical protein
MVLHVVDAGPMSHSVSSASCHFADVVTLSANGVLQDLSLFFVRMDPPPFSAHTVFV